MASDKPTETLPPCPLCGEAPEEFHLSGTNEDGAWCLNKDCALYGAEMTPGLWRRLAAPRVPLEVAAALRALGQWVEDDYWDTDEELLRAADKWIAAGRPGLAALDSGLPAVGDGLPEEEKGEK